MESGTKKDSNPKAAYGDAKVPLSVVPSGPLMELGLAMLEGHMKGYGSHNYRGSGCRISTYYNAIFRHLTAMWEGEDIDPESGLPHIIKIASCCFVLRDAQLMGIVTDDRPPKYEDGWQDKYKAHIVALKEKFPDYASVVPYTEKDQ